MARYVALLKLATERGHADRTQLRRLLTPLAYNQQFHPDVSTYLGAPLPTMADLGGTHVALASPQRALIAVAARQTAVQWGALTIDLRTTSRGRLLVADLLRVQDRHLSTTQPSPVQPTQQQMQQQLRELLRQRRIARETLADHPAAAMASRRSMPGSEPTVPPHTGWTSQLRRVDVEIGKLSERIAGKASPTPARLLGAQPAGGPAWDRWRQDYLELRDYQGWQLRAPGARGSGVALHEPRPTPSPRPVTPAVGFTLGR